MSLALSLTRQHGGDWRGDYGVIPTPGHSKRDRGTIIRDRTDGRGVYLYSFNHDDHRTLRAALSLTYSAPFAINQGDTVAWRITFESDNMTTVIVNVGGVHLDTFAALATGFP